METKVFVPPLKIQGIKTKLVAPIKKALQWNNTGTYFEPFMGSGVVGLILRLIKQFLAITIPILFHFIRLSNKESLQRILQNLIYNMKAIFYKNMGKNIISKYAKDSTRNQIPLIFCF